MNIKLLIIIFCTIAISIISGLNHLTGFIYQGNNYSLFSYYSSLSSAEEVFLYMPRTKEILNGAIIPRETQLIEYRNSPSPYVGEIIPTYIMAFFSFIFGSVEKGFIAVDFILPPIIFLLTYVFVKYFSKKTEVAVVSSLCLVLVREFFVYFPYPWQTFKYLFLKEDYIDNLIITRSFHPEVSIILFLLSLFSIYRALEAPSNKRIILSGILFGLTFYNYIFHWTTLMLGLGLMFFVNIKNSSTRRTIFLISVIALIIALPYLYFLAKFQMTPFAADFFFRSTGYRNEFPLPEARRFIVIAIIFFILLPKKIPYYFFNILIFTGAIMPDLSYMILKKDLESLHFVNIWVLPLTAIYFFYLLDKYILSKFNQKIKISIYIIACLSFVYYGLKIQLNSSLVFSRYQRFSPLEYDKTMKNSLNQINLFKFMRKNLSKDSVIISVPFSEFIYSASGIYSYLPYATRTVAGTREILERTVLTTSLTQSRNDITRDDVLKEMYRNTYSITNYNLYSTSAKVFKDQVLDIYDNLNRICKKFKVDYVLAFKKDVLSEKCFKTRIVYMNNRYILYKIIAKNK